MRMALQQQPHHCSVNPTQFTLHFYYFNACCNLDARYLCKLIYRTKTHKCIDSSVYNVVKHLVCVVHAGLSTGFRHKQRCVWPDEAWSLSGQ